MNYIKTGLLLAALTVLFIFVGSLIGGGQGAIIAFCIAMAMNWISYWFSDKIVLSMYRAKELPKDGNESLYGIVSDLCMKAEIPMPKLYVMDNQAPNAFATGRNPKHGCLCVTTGLLGIMDKAELQGVLAHELAHIKNRDTLIMTVTATIAGAIMMIANMARWAAIFGGARNDRNSNNNALGLIAAAIVAPIAAMIIQLAISRSREYGADEKGAQIAGSSFGLASALNKLGAASQHYRMNANPQTAHLFIVNPFHGNFIANLFSTHPPIAERIKRLHSLKI